MHRGLKLLEIRNLLDLEDYPGGSAASPSRAHLLHRQLYGDDSVPTPWTIVTEGEMRDDAHIGYDVGYDTLIRMMLGGLASSSEPFRSA